MQASSLRRVQVTPLSLQMCDAREEKNPASETSKLLWSFRLQDFCNAEFCGAAIAPQHWRRLFFQQVFLVFFLRPFVGVGGRGLALDDRRPLRRELAVE